MAAESWVLGLDVCPGGRTGRYPGPIRDWPTSVLRLHRTYQNRVGGDRLRRRA